MRQTVLIAALLAPAIAEKGAWENAVVHACAMELNHVTWDLIPPEGVKMRFYTRLCIYEPAIGSWATCIEDLLHENESEIDLSNTLDFLNGCCEYDRPLFTIDEVKQSIANASHYRRTPPEYNTTVVSWPLQLNATETVRIAKGYQIFLRNYDISDAYARLILIYFGIVSALGILFQLPWCHNWFFHSRPLNYIRGRFGLPTVGSKHADYKGAGFFSALIPSGIESLIIAGFVVVHIWGMVAGYAFDPDNVVAPQFRQFLRHGGNRTGILSFALLPIILVLSTRNSIVERLTGIRYTTSIALHKWLGRFMVLDVFLHGLAYRVHSELAGTAEIAGKQLYWRLGIIGAYSGVLLCVASVGAVRRYFYETFLVGHIVFAAIFMWLSWVHVKEFGWTGWVWVSGVAWLTERLIRIWRIWRFGGIVRARVEVFGADFLRVTIPAPSSTNWKMHPGQYAFLYFLMPTTFWQSHPFTLVSSHVDGNPVLIAVFQAKSGATSTLLRAALRNDIVPMLVEGPYGHVAPLEKFDHNLFLCGGTGIPGPLAHAFTLSESIATGKTKVHLVVVTRDTFVLQAWMDQLRALRDTGMNLQIYVTKPNQNQNLNGHSASPEYGSIETTGKVFQELSTFYDIKSGRPDPGLLLELDLDGTEGSIAVTCCGPPALVDATRNAVARAVVERPTRRVEYFEEYQTW